MIHIDYAVAALVANASCSDQYQVGVCTAVQSPNSKITHESSIQKRAAALALPGGAQCCRRPLICLQLHYKSLRRLLQPTAHRVRAELPLS